LTRVLFWTFPFLFSNYLGFSQSRTRLFADYSIKEKSGEKNSLVTGKIYFDKNSNKIVELRNFPIKETFVSTDSINYTISPGKPVKKENTLSPVSASIFSLCLSNSLFDYSLNAKHYKIKKKEKKDNTEITTWVPISKHKHFIGKILIAKENNLVTGVIVFDKNDNLLNKYFFRNYKKISNVDFPFEVISIGYNKSKENFKIITYENVIIDEKENSHLYDYPLPY